MLKPMDEFREYKQFRKRRRFINDMHKKLENKRALGYYDGDKHVFEPYDIADHVAGRLLI